VRAGFQTLNGGRVTIGGNLSFVNPADSGNGDNGFWGSTGPNEVKGNLTYTITKDYPLYTAPGLYR
jgi:hypothetical protein